MKTADIMTKLVHTIGPDQTLKECAEILKKRLVNGQISSISLKLCDEVL